MDFLFLIYQRIELDHQLMLTLKYYHQGKSEHTDNIQFVERDDKIDPIITKIKSFQF